MPPFTGSDVPLEEDILKKKVEFIQTWIEFAAQNFEQVIESANVTVNINNFFTVPDKKTLYITSAFINAFATVGLAAKAACNFQVLNDPETKILACIIDGTITSQNISINFPMPLKFESGIILQIGVDSNMDAIVGFHGFLVDKLISRR